MIFALYFSYNKLLENKKSLNLMIKAFFMTLEFSAFRCPWERNYVSDIRHSCYEKNQPF